MKKSMFTVYILGILIFAGSFIPQQTFAAEGLFYFYDNVYGYTNFKKNYKNIDTVAPQVYTVDYDLKVKRPSSTKILKEAKKKKVASMPLLVNANFSKVLMSDILLNQKAQDEIIDFMIKEADKYDFIGWQFDFENINHLDRDMYTAFVKKTSEKLKEQDLQFSVAVIPRSRPYDATSTNQDWSSGYDFKKIADYTDFMSLMSYDDPYSVGPVSSIPFTQKTVDYMMTEIPSEKISLGIPMYCWKWDDRTSLKIGSTTHKLAAKEYSKGKDKSKGYDEVLGAEWMKFTKDGTPYTIWCENEESIASKLDIIEDNKLRGFSAWALGQEPTWLWKILRKS